MDSRKIAKIAIKKKAMQKIKELTSLISLLKRRKLITVVEIGTAKGGSLYAWCRVAQSDATIISIDLPKGAFGGGYTLKEMSIFRKYKRKHQKLFFFRKNSHLKTTKKELLKKLNGRKIDFIMIDGDHTYSGVKKDFQMYSPLVKKDGLIVLHDILFHPQVRSCKVDKFWKEIKGNYKYKEFLDKFDERGFGRWGGIGVIYNR